MTSACTASRPAIGSVADSAASAASSQVDMLTAESWAPTGRTAAAAIESEVIPMPTSATARSGSAAASPHTPTGLRAWRPASAVIATMCSTAGCQGSVR